MKIIHISDLHFPKHGSLTNLFDKIINAYKNEEIKPLIIITGDLVDKPSKKSFLSVKRRLEILNQNGFKMLICPGNHDYKKAGNIALNRRRIEKLFNRNFQGFLIKDKNVNGESNNNFYRFPLIHKIEDHYFIGVDSMNKATYLATGSIGDKQLQKIKKEIELIRKKNNKAIITVYIHHKPFKFSWNYYGFDYDSMKLKNSANFLKVIEGVDILLFGHHHRNKQLFDKQKEHNIKIILNGSSSTSGRLEWFEIETSTNKVTNRFK